MSTRLPVLDRLVGGFGSGRLYALCAAENASPVPLALTIAHRLVVEAEIPVAYLCAAATREWVLREIAWEAVEVSSPYHYRGARTAAEEQQLHERIAAIRDMPLHLLSAEEIPPDALERSLRALSPLPRLVIVEEGLGRPDTAPDALQVPVLLLCSLQPAGEDGPHLTDVPEALARNTDVLLAIGNPRFGEEQDEEAIPDYFYTPLTPLGEEPATTVLLRFDLTTNRFARED